MTTMYDLESTATFHAPRLYRPESTATLYRPVSTAPFARPVSTAPFQQPQSTATLYRPEQTAAYPGQANAHANSNAAPAWSDSPLGDPSVEDGQLFRSADVEPDLADYDYAPTGVEADLENEPADFEADQPVPAEKPNSFRKRSLLAAAVVGALGGGVALALIVAGRTGWDEAKPAVVSPNASVGSVAPEASIAPAPTSDAAPPSAAPTPSAAPSGDPGVPASSTPTPVVVAPSSTPLPQNRGAGNPASKGGANPGGNGNQGGGTPPGGNKGGATPPGTPRGGLNLPPGLNLPGLPGAPGGQPQIPGRQPAGPPRH
jgi:hypothetical protein